MAAMAGRRVAGGQEEPQGADLTSLLLTKVPEKQKEETALRCLVYPTPLRSTDSPRYWAIQRSWFARVNALCNLSRKMSREVAAHFRADF